LRDEEKALQNSRNYGNLDQPNLGNSWTFLNIHDGFVTCAGSSPTDRETPSLCGSLALVSASIGNGVNDIEMIREAALGIAVIGPEGTAAATVAAAVVVCRSIGDALGLLLDDRALAATFRLYLVWRLMEQRAQNSG